MVRTVTRHRGSLASSNVAPVHHDPFGVRARSQQAEALVERKDWGHSVPRKSINLEPIGDLRRLNQHADGLKQHTGNWLQIGQRYVTVWFTTCWHRAGQQSCCQPSLLAGCASCRPDVCVLVWLLSSRGANVGDRPKPAHLGNNHPADSPSWKLASGLDDDQLSKIRSINTSTESPTSIFCLARTALLIGRT